MIQYLSNNCFVFTFGCLSEQKHIKPDQINSKESTETVYASNLIDIFSKSAVSNKCFGSLVSATRSETRF